MEQKRCTQCGETKALDEFYRRLRGGKIYYSSSCKKCRNLAEKERRLSNPNYLKNWREAHPEYQRNWRKEHLDYQHNWGNANPGYHHKWRKEHPGYDDEWRHIHAQETRARRAVQTEIHAGRLPRVKTCKCVRCGTQAQEYHHHHGYDEHHKLDVIPVCKRCHNILDHNL